MSTKVVNVAVIGAGVVGSAFLDQLLAMKSTITYNLVLLAEAERSLISKDFSPLNVGSDWKAALAASTTKTLPLDDLIAHLKTSPKPVILVDNTSSAYIAGFTLSLSKMAFSSDLATWKALFSNKPTNGFVYHEATVGAGLPIISFLREIIQTGDEVEKIEGIFSGTLSYIFNEFSTSQANDVKFSDVVKVAKKLGYTEPDPRDDLNGLDVARKVTIVGRISGVEVESPTSFPVQSLIPKPLESVKSADEFLEKLSDYDKDLTQLKKEAATENKVLRFIGKVDVATKSVSVGIEKYDYSHPFASLKGSDNVISIKTKRYTNPVVIQGAGAGAAVTAAGVLGDVIKIAQRL
ncbi:ANM_collapsed_G0031150.mRNA.1.CDS.1 [Saccharomyces cerevisiae]|nr:ANM_collapsed_G0031150.mRNA.1.CDS.1 [Saccharomyces cerevisiae]